MTYNRVTKLGQTVSGGGIRSVARQHVPACVRGWLDEEMTWFAPQDGRPGRPAVFSNAAIQFCLSIEVLFKLVAIGAPSVRVTMATRQTAGMVASLLRMAGPDWPTPDYSTLCRRQKIPAVQIPYRRADGPPSLLVPSRDIPVGYPAG